MLDEGPELAPSVVVRVPCWPIETLEQLPLAHGSKLGDAATRAVAKCASYEAAYDQALGEERRCLWRLTVQDPAFLRALALSAPDFSARLEERAFPPRRNKKGRQLDGALYRYLARAVGRTEPADAWAGVAMGVWGAEYEVTADARRLSFAPDLRPFQSMLASLSRLPRYAASARYRLNPTLTRNAELGVLRRGPGGVVAPVRMPTHPALELVVEVSDSLGEATRAELVGQIAESVEASEREILGLIDLAIDQGLLVGGLAFPLRFNTPWQALLNMARLLVAEDRGPLVATTRALRRLCRRLERTFDDLSPVQVRATLGEAGQIMLRLADRLGIHAPEIPSATLRGDLKLGCRFQFGRALQERMRTAVVEATRWEQRYGLMDASASLMASHYLADGPCTLMRLPAAPSWGGLAWRQEWACWEAICAHVGSPAKLAGAIREQVATLRRGGRLDPQPLPEELPPPLGSVVFRFAPDALQIVGLSPEPAMTLSRVEALLGNPSARTPSTPAGVWLADQLVRLQHETSIVPVEYVAPLEHRPNALAHPTFLREFVAPWTVHAGALDLRGTHIEPLFSNSTAGLLRLADGRLAACMSMTSANLTSTDPVGEALLLTSFRGVPRWVFSIPNVPFRHELEAPVVTPPLMLDDGTSLSRMRLVLHGDVLSRLMRASPALRFADWQHIVRGAGFGPLVYARRDQEQPLLVPVESALAVEVLFDRPGRELDHIILEACHDHTRIFPDAHERYILEVAVPFVRRRHCWQASGTRVGASRSGAHEVRP